MHDMRGRCYESASRYVLDTANAGDESARYVQGTIIRLADGRIIDHAWAEHGDAVIDRTISDDPIDKTEYYSATHAHPRLRADANDIAFARVIVGKHGPYTDDDIARARARIREMDARVQQRQNFTAQMRARAARIHAKDRERRRKNLIARALYAIGIDL